MEWDEICSLYMQMKKSGAVVYGAGRNGRIAIDFLERCHIAIKAVADIEKKKIKTYKCLGGVDILPESDSVVCICTPLHLDCKTKSILKQKFKYCVDMAAIDVLNVYIPETGKCFYRPFNHFESPFPSNNELRIGSRQCGISGINFNLLHQKEFARYIASHVADFDLLIGDGDTRYNVVNGAYGYEDALVLYSMLNFYQPRRYIEIGSGWTTCLVLDVYESCLSNSLDIECIEPYPQKLLHLIKDSDKSKIVLHQDFVQNIEENFFDCLEANDILFIDSSHVLKYGGDVLYEYFSILPRLKSGTIIQIHDIFKDFSYPKEWASRCLTEAYILRALLSDSDRYDILYFTHMMHNDLCEHIGHDIAGGGSIWLRVR